MKNTNKKLATVIFMFSLFIPLCFTQQNKTISELVSKNIHTKDGKLTLHHTKHLPKGNFISGKLLSQPISDKPNKRQRQIDNLKGYILKLDDEIISHDGIFTIKLPEKDFVSLQTFTPENKLISIEFLST